MNIRNNFEEHYGVITEKASFKHEFPRITH